MVALGWLAWQAADGALRPGLVGLAVVGLAGAAWLYARHQRFTALAMLVLLSPLAWHFVVALPAARGVAGAAAQQGRYVRVEGTVRRRVACSPGARVRLLLGRAWVASGGRRQSLAELEAELPAHSVWQFPYRRRVRIGGVLRPGRAGVRLDGERLRLMFARAQAVRQTPPIRAWNAEALRLRLRD